ncbi:MAG TPA: hypothetical protein VFY83_16120 [Anaerolineales bacterium]|nr:hypothetical protein [Anaerolineales bacterium]
MEAAFQTYLQQNWKSRLTVIEAIELSLLGFGLWSLMAIISGDKSVPNDSDLMTFLLITEGIVLGSWVVYNIYICVARAAGYRVDIALWMIASAFTGSFTFWAWTVLDLNRLLMVKLFYEGAAPVEYAWSAKSKQTRKIWEKTQKAANA